MALERCGAVSKDPNWVCFQRSKSGQFSKIQPGPFSKIQSIQHGVVSTKNITNIKLQYSLCCLFFCVEKKELLHELVITSHLEADSDSYDSDSSNESNLTRWAAMVYGSSRGNTCLPNDSFRYILCNWNRWHRHNIISSQYLFRFHKILYFIYNFYGVASPRLSMDLWLPCQAALPSFLRNLKHPAICFPRIFAHHKITSTTQTAAV